MDLNRNADVKMKQVGNRKIMFFDEIGNYGHKFL